MIQIYGIDESLPEYGFFKQLRKRYKAPPRYMAQKVGAILKLEQDHKNSDQYTLQLDHDVLHIIHRTNEAIGNPVMVMTLPYQIFEDFVRWYGKGWWEEGGYDARDYRKDKDGFRQL